MSRSLRFSAVAGLLLALIGCSADRKHASDTSAVTTVTTAPATTSTTAAAAQPDPSFKLLDVHSGDAACYLQVSNAEGAEESLPGDFELCPGGSSDATPLIGRTVNLERRPERILADSCSGDPACQDTKPVEIVVRVKPAG